MEDLSGRRNFSFQMQIGLTRDQINIDGELTLASLQEIACSFVDRKVSWSAVRFFLLTFHVSSQIRRKSLRLSNFKDVLLSQFFVIYKGIRKRFSPLFNFMNICFILLKAFLFFASCSFSSFFFYYGNPSCD